MSSNTHKRRTSIIRWIVIFLTGLGSPAWSYAQYSISGANCVVSGTQYTYTVGGNWTNYCTMTWSVTNGTFSGSSSGTPLPQTHITWNTSTTGLVQVTVNCPSGHGTSGSGSLSVTANATLTGGTISNPSQSINYNTT